MTPLSNELKNQLKNNKSWHEQCPISLDRLYLLNIEYYNFTGKICDDGKMIVFDVIAQSVLDIFNELKTIKFPIDKIRLIDDYGISDEKSMSDNNSVCFCYRTIKDTNIDSIHSYGMAIDINPVQNPVIYTKQNRSTVLPKAGKEFLDRDNIRPGMVTKEVIEIFNKHGFTTWGGKWRSPIDYHHFQIPRNICKQLISMSYQEGIKFIK